MIEQKNTNKSYPVQQSPMRLIMDCNPKAMFVVIFFALVVGGVVWFMEELKIRDFERARQLEKVIYEKSLERYRHRTEAKAVKALPAEDEKAADSSGVSKDCSVLPGLWEATRFIYSKQSDYPAATADDGLVTNYLADKKTGAAAFVVRGERYCEDEAGSARGFQKILKLITPAGEEKVLYTTERPAGYCNMSFDVCCLDFSPDGRYLFYSKTGWEYAKPYMVNIKTQKYVIGDDSDISNIDSIVWSDSTENFALSSVANDMIGSGEVAVYASAFNNPDLIRKIWSAEDQRNKTVTELRFTDSASLSFKVTVDEEGFLRRTSYGFDLETGKLTESIE